MTKVHLKIGGLSGSQENRFRVFCEIPLFTDTSATAG